MSSDVSRRKFLERCGLAAGMVGAVATQDLLTRQSLSATQQFSRPATASAAAQGKVGPNDRIRMGFIGLGSRGRQTARVFLSQSDVEAVAVCDCHRPRAEDAAKAFGGNAEVYTDFRLLLERKDVDAVSISTPDHWHALPTILACEAGKDVFVEKPLALTVAEGRTMVQAARRFQRVIQAGTQCRSSEHFYKAKEIVQSGQLGRIHQASAWITSHWGPSGIGNPPDSDPPEGLDWEMWQGPAPRRPYNPSRFQRFRQFWDYAGGTTTDRGVHLIDIVQMCLGIDFPVTVVSTGGRYVFDDNGQTPDTQEILYEVEMKGQRLLMTWEHREANSQPVEGRGLGIAFYGSQGTLIADYGGFVLYPEGKREPGLVERGQLEDVKHVRNFLDCVRSRQHPVADVEICQRSSSTTILGNISLLLGRKLRWDGTKEQFIDDREANKMLRPRYRKPWKLPKI